MNFTHQVSAGLRAVDPTLALLKQKSFAKDYFPYGGLIGGGKLALPKLLTQGIPPEWNDLLAKSGDLAAGFTQAKGQAWLTAFEQLGTFLTSTESTGQLAFYLPAPNPVLLPGETSVNWEGMTVDSLMRRLKTDPAALIGRTVNANLYPLDEIVFAGWTKAKLLGVDFAQARINYANRQFTATAEIQPNPATGTDNNWFNDYFSGSAQFSIELPRDQETGLTGIGATDLFGQLAGTIGEMRGLDATAMENRIKEVQARLAGALPRIAMELSAGVNLPPLLNDFIRPQASAGLKVFAFSPYYDPDYQPADQTGYAAARRQGGAGFCGNIRFGYFPGGQELFGVDLSQACLTILAPTPLSPLPGVIGDLAVPSFALPGGFSFSGQAHFNSSPLVNQDFLAITGAMSPITLGNFLQVTPLAAGQTQLGGTLHVTRTAGAPATVVSLKPARVSLPVLGGINGTISGGVDGDGNLTDFTFSSVPGQPWQAQVAVQGNLEIRDPFNAAADVVFRASTPAGASFSGKATGTGTDSYTIEIQIPNGINIELFPGKSHGSKFTIGDNSLSCLFVKSDGTIYYDSGTRVIPLGSTDPAKSFASLTGRVEFGHNPAAPAPTVTYGALNPYSTGIGSLSEQVLTVTASGGTARGRVIVDAATGTSDEWSVEPSRLIVGAGQTANFRVLYHPTSTAVSSAVLTLTEVRDGSSVNTTRSLSGTPLTAALVQLSGTTLDFGTVPLGQPAGKVLQVTNAGNAALTLSVPAPAAPFSLLSAASVTVPANGTASLLFNFNPDTDTTISRTILLTSNSTAFPDTTITLAGRGAKSLLWEQVRRGDGSDVLRGVGLRTGTGGKLQAVGDHGLFLTNGSTAQVWKRQRNTGGTDLRAIQLPSATLGWAAGDKGKVFKSTNGGTSWSAVTDTQLAQGSWRAIATINPATGFVVFAGSPNGKTDGAMVRQTAATTFTSVALPDGTSGLHGIAFSSATNGIAVGEAGLILRSTNGGANWTAIDLPITVPATTVLRGVAAVASTVLVIVGDAGTVLRSADGGATWTKIAVPVTSDLLAVAMQTVSGIPSGIAVGRQGVILATATGSAWTRENSGITENLTAAVMGSTPAVVSAAGDILMRRAASASPSASIQSNLNEAGFDSMTKDQGGYGDILVNNSGGAPMTAGVTSSNPAFTITPSATQTIPAGSAARFTVSFTAPGADASTTITINTSDPSLPSSTLPIAVKAKSGVQLPIGLLHGPALLDLGTRIQGSSALNFALPLLNLGLADAVITRYSVRSVSDDFTAEGMPSISPGKGEDLKISFTPATIGRQRAVFEVLSDAWNGVLPVEVTANVVPVPEQVVLRSNLASLPVTVNGSAVTLPAVYTLSDSVDDLPNRILLRGKVITVTAPLTTGTGTNLRTFDAWSESASNVLVFTGGQTARELTASYDRSQTAGAVPSAAPVLAPTCLFSVPSDTPAGPWVKVSQARLSLPWLGDPATGTRFQVQGAAFFSLTRGDASLTSSGVVMRVPVTTATTSTGLANRRVLEITPGSWRMAYLNNNPSGAGTFSLASSTPGLRIFEKSVVPPSVLSATVPSNLAGPVDNNATIAFATTDDLPLAPPHLALGASSFSAQAGLFASLPVLNLSTTTQLRALGNGRGGYRINQSYGFVFNPTLPAITPLTVAQGTDFLNLGFLRLTGGPGGSTIGPAVTPAGFTLRANNWDLRFFDSPDPINVSAAVDSTAKFTLSGSFPPEGLAPFSGSPFILKPGADLAISATIDPLKEHVTCHWPALTLDSKASSGSAVWDPAKIQFPPVDFDSSNFTLRCPLPAFNFSKGFTIAPRPDRDADNYIALAFTSSSASFRLRERQNFVLGTLRRDFDISTNGTLSGALHGRLGLTGPPPLDAVQEQISFEFTTANPSFVVNRSLFLVGARFELGRTGFFPSGRASVLVPDPTKPISDWQILVP